MTWFYQEMPLDKHGSGPAPAEDTVTVLHQIWDDTFSDIADCIDKETAMQIVAQHNKIERLTKALEPFAKLNLFPEDIWDDHTTEEYLEHLQERINKDEVDGHWIKPNDIRAARAARKD